MPCRVRYLNSVGIHRREIPGIEALSAAYPETWLLYASLQCFEQHADPFDVDAMVVMDDRVLLLEIKDWNGTIVARGDRWVVNDKSRKSPITNVSEKARKLASFLRGRIGGFGRFRVDPRVVLTGSAQKPDLRPEERRLVWSLDEAVAIASQEGRLKLLETATLGLKKAFEFERDFERITGNGRMFGPSERKWDGYKVVEEDYVTHPRGIWREHRAELNRDARRKALLRIWAFDELPPTFNSPAQRRAVTDREAQIIGHLAARGRNLTQQGGILMPIGGENDDILTEHYELRDLPSNWTTLDRWLERAREALDEDDRRNTVASLLNLVAEFHDHDVEHRDLGSRSIWIGSPTQLALSGFMVARVPGDPPLADLHQALRGYARLIPPEPIDAAEGSGKRRDVFHLGHLASDILLDRPASDIADAAAPMAAAFADWLAKATASLPSERFPNARAMAEEFGSLIDQASSTGIDRSLFARFETTDIPYTAWVQSRFLSTDPWHQVYVSADASGIERVVKIWPGLGPGRDVGLDVALARLCDAASRLETSPVQGIPALERVGISPVGTFVVEAFAEGTFLSDTLVLDAAGALRACETLISTVDSLHAMGFQHGRIAPSRILLDQEGGIKLLGTFDLPVDANAAKRSSGGDTSAPMQLSVEQLDRHAVVSSCLSLIATVDNAHFEELIAVLRKELERPAIEVLEPSLLAIRKAGVTLVAPYRPRFEVFDKDAGPDFFRSDNGTYYLRVRRPQSNTVEYQLAGVDRELIFTVVDGQLSDARTEKATFSNLSHASQHGIPVEIDVIFFPGEDKGLEELFAFIQPLAKVPDEVAEIDRPPETAPPRQFDVRRFWRRHLELEEEFQPEIEILRQIDPNSGSTDFYGYERVGRDWDTDTDARVEVISSNGRKNGEVDLAQTDSRILAVRFANKPLLPGDRISLVEQRSRTSLDRRTRAVERILEDEAAIDGLIDYFSPQCDAKMADYGIDVDDASLEAYGLNSGQRKAFRHIARFGPVGLLQGPPGTGKTRFIAAFVHWLITVRGARRILITSQSHEAVNNVIETLVDLFKTMRKRPSLLRIGSKGITDKIRPFHVDSVRERYRARFDAAFRHRVQGLCGSMGIKRAFTADAVEIDRRLGAPAKHLALLAKAGASTLAHNKRDRRRKTAFIKTSAAFRKAGLELLGREVDADNAMLEVERAYEQLLERNPGASQADVRNVRAAIALSHEWSSSLATSHRNFEEFLGKTREIVTATCVGAGQTKIRLDAGQFDWVVVDEAARCTAGELAVPIQAGRRVLLVGDHRQLLPMVEREVIETLQKEMPEASRADLGRSDFERSFLSSYGKINGTTLTEQYRMAPAICRLVSKVFYEPYGVSLTTSADRVPNPLFTAELPQFISQPITWVDTTQAVGSAERHPEWSTTTFWNEAETDAVMDILEKIAESADLVLGLKAEATESPIGVICMYSAQKLMIEQAFSQRPWEPAFRRLVRIDTVDSYQGKENTIVIVSLVRNNRRGDPGHVRIANRCNVALSRAKERIFIVGARQMWAGQKASQPMSRTIEHIDSETAGAQTLKAGQLG